MQLQKYLGFSKTYTPSNRDLDNLECFYDFNMKKSGCRTQSVFFVASTQFTNQKLFALESKLLIHNYVPLDKNFAFVTIYDNILLRKLKSIGTNKLCDMPGLNGTPQMVL